MSSDQQKLDKIRKLIALSASNQIEEARTSAYMACKLIREGGFEVVERGGQKWHNQTTSAPPPRTPPPPQPPPQTPPRNAQSGSRSSAAAWVSIKSKYPGYCRICRDEIDAGENIYWKRGEGSVHAACHRP